MIILIRKIVSSSRKNFFLLFFMLYSSIGANSQEQELSPFLDYDLKGYFEFEYRYFPKKDRKRIASQTNQSVAMSFDLFLDFKKPDLSLLIAPFARIDQRDVSRNILDLSEFYLSFTKPKWELKIGSKKLFWGVLESNHLVDIVNQTNNAESFDLEEKLGQPMVNLTFINEWGSIDLFLLTLNRKRRFVSQEGRPNTGFENILQNGTFEAKSGDFDYIVRYENSGDMFDIGAYYFDGLARSPEVMTEFISQTPSLTTLYPIVKQLAIDLQITKSSTLLKLESLYRESQREDYSAIGLGFEHTLYGVIDSKIDLGLLFEYHWNNREENLSSQFSNDLFFGLRVLTNEISDGQLLFGILNNLNDGGVVPFLEGSIRLPKNWRLYLEGRLFSHIDSENPLSDLTDDSYLQLALTKYF
ncbi:MAG: hypothetical protein CBC29_01735 [Methylococcaceae bacterium TMED69]|nr:MAG: hypothetical protein CBC29_01735 [Methylococcaceae bacterium TMED69]